MVLYQMEHTKAEAASALEVFAANFKAPARLFHYARSLVEGVSARQPEIDEMLQAVSRRWKLARMPGVDRSILRLACYEMFFSQGQVPPKVAINEAVELAKRFGTAESPVFINGVLDSLLSAQGPRPAPAPSEPDL